MKKSLFIVLLFILSINSVLAVSINLDKQTYSPYETLIAEISGNFNSNLQLSNIHFFRDSREISLSSDVVAIGDKYYLYALLPSVEGNYSIRIKDIISNENNTLKDVIAEKNFSISPSNGSVIQVSPGVIVARDDFYLTLENKGKESEKLSVKFFEQKFDFTLSPSAIKKLSFTLEGIDDTIGEIVISSNSENIYTIPVKIYPLQKNNTIPVESYQFSFKDKDLNATLAIKDTYLFQKELFNYALSSITKVKVNLVGDSNIVQIAPKEITEIQPGNSEKINITIKSDKTGLYSFVVIASYGDISTNLSINLNLTENDTQLPYNRDTTTCADLNGTVCGVAESCNIDTRQVGMDVCCFGICQAAGSGGGGGGGLWTGIIIILIVAAIGAGIFFYVKNKKVKTGEDIIKEKSTEFEHSLKMKE